MPEYTEEQIESDQAVQDTEVVVESLKPTKERIKELEQEAFATIRKSTHRCGKCNKSKHSACAGGDCHCLCRTHTVSKGRPEPERHYSAESNNHIEQVLAAYRAGKTPPEPVPDTKAE